MTTVSTRKSAKQKPPAPPTLLTLTLNPDGTGTLVTKRGDLAYMNSFTYRDMKGIITAIQQGAAHLVEIEKNPPPKELFTTPAPSSPQPVQPVDEASVTEVAEVPATASPTTGDEPTTTPDFTENDDLPVTADEPLAGVVPPNDTVQLTLL